MRGELWSMFKRNSSNNKNESDGVPSSLPGTLADKESNAQNDSSQTKEDKHVLPRDLHEPPKDFKKISFKEKVEEPEEVVTEKVSEVKEDNTSENKEDSEVEKNKHSFFNEIERKFSNEKSSVEEHFSSDIIKKMKEYHDAKVKGGNYFFDESDADDHIYSLLIELKELEAEWSLRYRELETAKELLEKKEVEVEEKLAEFENALKNKKKFKLFEKKAPEGQEFILCNGVRVSSIKGLLFELKHMSEDVFNHHVNFEKNDFANWIRYVFTANVLADKVLEADSLNKLVKILNSY